MTQAVTGTDGELVGVLLVARNVANMSRVQSMLAYSRKLVALGRLTAGIAHEVKNPLNAMMIHLELLRTKIRNAAAWAAAPQPQAGRRRAGWGWPTAAPEMPAAAQGRARARRNHRERDPPARRRGAGVPEVHAARGSAAAAGAAVPALFEGILPVVEPEAQKNGVRVVAGLPGVAAAGQRRRRRCCARRS